MTKKKMMMSTMMMMMMSRYHDNHYEASSASPIGSNDTLKTYNDARDDADDDVESSVILNLNLCCSLPFEEEGSADLHADASQPATGRPALFVLSFPFPLIPASSRDLNFISFIMQFPGISLHFLSLMSAPFISLNAPSLALLSFSCFSSLHVSSDSLRSNFPLQRLLHAVSLAFPFRFLQFSAPCFASLARIASSASSRIMLAMLGVLSSIRHPENTRFWTKRGDATNNLQILRLLKGRKTYAHGLLMVGGMGRTALYLKVSPAGLACGPITSGGRI